MKERAEGKKAKGLGALAKKLFGSEEKEGMGKLSPLGQRQARVTAKKSGPGAREREAERARREAEEAQRRIAEEAEKREAEEAARAEPSRIRKSRVG